MTFGEFQADTVTFGTRKSTQVMISDEMIDLLPDEAITIKKTANKTAIKDLSMINENEKQKCKG